MSQTEPRPIEDAAEAAAEFQRYVAGGLYREAIDLADSLPPEQRHPRTEFIRALEAVLEHEIVGAPGWRAHLDALAERNGAEILKTTFLSDNGAAMGAIEGWLENTGDLPAQHRQGRRLSLITHGEQTCRLESQDLPDCTNGIVLHMLLLIRSNVNESFYVGVTDKNPERGEQLRFGRASVTLCRDAAKEEIDARVTRLYSLVIEPRQVSVYVNGELLLRKSRQGPIDPQKVVVELIGKFGGDLEGRVWGLEAWRLTGPFAGMVAGESDRLQHRVRALLNNGDARGLWRMLQSIEGLDLAGMQEQVLELMNRLAASHDGLPEWVIDTLYRSLPEAGKRIWEERREEVMPSPVIEAEDVRVVFSRNPAKDWSLGRLLRRKKRDRFNVLDELNFRIFPGDIVGIIGQNGAGKSTMLRVLAGLIPIQQGRVFIRGQAVLLKAGVGMRPHLTGRDNISHAGAYMGLSREQIKQITKDVIEFSELGEAIDRPFKYYSDGMKSRLIFSLATSISPDILMLDELLGAGDIRFRQKVQDRLDAFIESARVVIVVTHGLNFVRQRCNKALFLSSGQQMFFGDPETAIAHYLNELHLLPGAVGLGPQDAALDDASLTLAEMEMNADGEV